MKKQLTKGTQPGSTSKIAAGHGKISQPILATLTNRPSLTHDSHRSPAHDRETDAKSPSDLDIVLQPIVKVTAPLGSLDLEVLLLERASNTDAQSADVSNVHMDKCGDRARQDRRLLATALDWLHRHESTLKMTRFFCVNLHAESVNDARSIAETVDILRQYEKVLSYLCLQISETTEQVSLENLQHFLHLAQNMGAKVMLNDFGSGYNSLYFLQHLSADALRIDGNLIADIHENPKSASIVEGIVQLARNLGMASIATGVNDLRTLRLLIDLGVDYVQGSAVAKPQQPNTIAEASSASPFIDEAALATFVQAMADSDNQSMISAPIFYSGNLH